MSTMPAVATVVPHEPPMLMLDALVDYGAGYAVAERSVPDDRFARDGRVDAVVTFECMAQTVAACLGCEALAEGGRVRVGMVVACRSMTIERPVLTVGETLRFEARRVRGTESTSHFECDTHDADGALVSRCTLTLVHGERLPG